MTPAEPAGESPVLHVRPGNTPAEVAADALWQLGATAVEHRDGAVVGGFGSAAATTSAARTLAGRFTVWVEAVPQWHDHWLEHVPVTTVAGIRIGPSHTLRTPGPDHVVIDAARSFGSGAHVSTRLALEQLVALDLAGTRVLDVGTGSGVLGIVAAARGATQVRMVDIDADAVAAARSNVAANDLGDRCQVLHRAPQAGDGPVDVVVANLLCAHQLEVARAVAGAAGSTGTVVVSGLLVDQLDTVAAAHPGRHVSERVTADGWVAATFRP